MPGNRYIMVYYLRMKTTVFYKDNLDILHTDQISVLKNKNGRKITRNLYLFSCDPETWLVNVETLAMRQIVDPMGRIVGFSDEDIDWSLDIVRQNKQKVLSRQVYGGNLEGICCKHTVGGIMLKWCFHHGYGDAGDCDGFGVEPDEWEYLYIHVDENCGLLSKWTSLANLQSLL